MRRMESNRNTCVHTYSYTSSILRLLDLVCWHKSVVSSIFSLITLDNDTCSTSIYGWTKNTLCGWYIEYVNMCKLVVTLSMTRGSIVVTFWASYDLQKLCENCMHARAYFGSVRSSILYVVLWVKNGNNDRHFWSHAHNIEMQVITIS